MVGVDPRSIAEQAARELTRAQAARFQGQEGRARVCARRAAGWAASAYFRRVTGTAAPRSALSLLKWLQQAGTVDEEIRNAAMRLTEHVTPSFEQPFKEDPLEDARRIVDAFAAFEG